MADRALGQKGEAVAARYYQKQGFALLDHGWRTRIGELDLVLRSGDLLVVAEVKTRSSRSFSEPREAVDRAKQRRIILAAGEYLAAYPELADQCTVRFDVVEVLPAEGGWRVRCIPAAFEAGG